MVDAGTVRTFAQGLAEAADEIAALAVTTTDPVVLTAMQDAVTAALLPVGQLLFSLTGAPFVRRSGAVPARAAAGR